MGQFMTKHGVAIATVVAVLATGARFWSVATHHSRYDPHRMVQTSAGHGQPIQSRSGGDDEVTIDAGQMPVCDSDVVRDLLKQVLMDSPAAKQGLKIL